MISVCVAVYRVNDTPNVAGLGATLPAALGGHDGELVIALNGVEADLLGLPSSARTLDLKINRGLAPAWNAAAHAAEGEVLVFCNDDVELGAGSLARLTEPLLRDRSRHLAVVGPVGANWDIARGKHVAWVGPDEDSRADPAECDAVSGFLFACRRQTWEAVGGFDEFYAPASWEEIDFCTAVRAIGGHCYAVAGVSCKHEWGVSRRQPPWARARWEGGSETWRSIHRRNRRHFLEKWAKHPIPAISAASRTPT